MHRTKTIFGENIYIHTIICILLISLLSGCGASLFANRESNPVIQDIAVPTDWYDTSLLGFLWNGLTGAELPWAKKSEPGINTFSTTVSRRMVITNYTSKDGYKLCAEPPPDVGETFASVISDATKLAATEPKTGVNGTLSNDYARAVTTQIAPLIYRTQALQIYREAVHGLCVDAMNGRYPDNKEYNDKKIELFNSTIELLKIEIPQVLDAQTAFFQNQGNTGITADKIQALVGLVKNLSPTTITATPSGTSIITSPNATAAPQLKQSGDK